MTVVILHPPGRSLPPYPEWLAGVATDLVLVTGPATAAGAGYADVLSIVDYETSARVETAVLDIAERTDLTAIVAVGVLDQIRAGGLRDHLGLPGPGRDTAIGLVDGVRAAGLLADAGVPSLPRGRVRRAVDLYWYAHRWGCPLRIRSRRVAGWPTVVVLHDRDELRAFTEGGLPANQEVMPSLMAEPVVAGERHRGVFALDGDRARAMDKYPDAHTFTELAGGALSAVDAMAGWPHHVEAVSSDEGEWLVETISCDPTPATPGADFLLCAVVRAQVGQLPALARVV
ncbi:MAG TPA: hypothetical protein VJT49_13675 [Amycolatopsis sp.]|uniref:hypothetical protein n=1 Tax=Amycolatopsis sp. TaxID=37632 RepID=UPI002B46D404|nr:hypothetical protein [Amycolatopsis sp.]HKS46135.1 hypothetical protein [Amycolatopsis sp.]